MDADAIVIGAGAAGLAAARALAVRGARVLLVEARDRIGGRVWSRPGPRAVTPAELGAEFIHGPAPETMALLREAGSAAVDTGEEGWVRRQGSDLTAEGEQFFESAALFDGALSLDEDESVARYLARFEGDAELRERARFARAFVEGFDAADPEMASARAIAQEWSSGVDSRSGRPLGGYAPVFDRLHNACRAAGVELLLATAAARVVWRSGSVAIDVVDAAGEVQTLRGRTAIVTLPVGVLRHCGDETEVLFEPELPPEKRAALAAIEMGHVVKVALWFRSAFWERVTGERYRNGAFFHLEGAPIATYWTQLPLRSELIIAWAGGPPASALEESCGAERIDLALRGLAELFGEPELIRREFEGGLTHDWSADPCSRGAYSYVRVGGAAARATLAEPLAESLFFAGEATAGGGQAGTVNGALASGQRAALQAASVLGL